jgi:hypothetical protein
MPRIIVTTEGSTRPDAPVLLDEWVHPQHLQDNHSADQLIERSGWAVNDADDLERNAPVAPRGGRRNPANAPLARAAPRSASGGRCAHS